MRRAGTLSLAFLALLVLAGTARAQDEEPSYAPASEAHRPGRWSMQFEVADDLQLVRFDGAGIAVTRNSSLSGAWRLGASFSGDFISGDVSSEVSGSLGNFESSDKLPDNNRYAVNLDLLRLHRVHPQRRFGLEFALGPRFGFDHQSFTQQVSIDTSGIADQETRFSSQRYGVLGRLGVEVFLARSISLHAHYGAFVGYAHRKQTQDSHESFFDGTQDNVHTETTIRQWSLTNEGVTLGLSAYL